MNDCVDVRAMLVNHFVHRPFGRNLVIRRFQRIAVQINRDHHVGRHPAFADRRWRSDATVFTNSDADVAIARDQQASVVTPSGDLNYLLFDLLLDQMFLVDETAAACHLEKVSLR